MSTHRARTSALRLLSGRISLLVLSLALCTVATGVAMAGEPQRHHVVGDADIQARIDQQLEQERADRQAIQQLLDQPGVRQIAESAGLDLKRAQTAAALLSGPELKDLAANAREIDAGVGGSSIVITATTLIIILLIIIILTK
jgi:hypothetical protein